MCVASKVDESERGRECGTMSPLGIWMEAAAEGRDTIARPSQERGRRTASKRQRGAHRGGATAKTERDELAFEGASGNERDHDKAPIVWLVQHWVCRLAFQGVGSSRAPRKESSTHKHRRAEAEPGSGKSRCGREAGRGAGAEADLDRRGGREILPNLFRPACATSSRVDWKRARARAAKSTALAAIALRTEWSSC